MNEKDHHTLRYVLVPFGLIAVILAGVAVTALRNINRSIASNDWVNHTHAASAEVNDLFGSLQAADGALRSFLLTGDPRDKAACRQALSAMLEHLEVAQSLARSEPAQARAIQPLVPLLGKRLEFTRTALAAREQHGAEAVRGIMAEDAGGEAIQEIRHVVENVENDTDALLVSRDQESYRQAQTARWTVLTGVALEFLLLAGAAGLVVSDVSRRRRSAAALRAANESLESRVHARTAELAAANQELTNDNLERRWANQALEHQLRYDNLIINSIEDLVFVLTKTLHISRINPAVVHLTGREPKELISIPLSQVVRLFEDRQAEGGPMLDPIAQALKDGRDLRDRPAIVTDRKGRMTAVRFNLFPLRDRDKVVGGVVTLRIVAMQS